MLSEPAEIERREQHGRHLSCLAAHGVGEGNRGPSGDAPDRVLADREVVRFERTTKIASIREIQCGRELAPAAT